jgi:hypothetical protein
MLLTYVQIKAEMDATKAENIHEHRAEIMSRPKKTWFQSQFEKDRLKQEGKDAFDGVVAPEPEPVYVWCCGHCSGVCWL